MARYRGKDEVDLSWNDIRRTLTSQLHLRVRAWEDRALNKILIAAWQEFVARQEQEPTPELEAHYADWVQQALEEALGDGITIEADAVDVPLA